MSTFAFYINNEITKKTAKIDKNNKNVYLSKKLNRINANAG